MNAPSLQSRLVMKRVALVLSLALLPPSLASAQVGFGAAAGASLPIGDFGNIYDSGYHAQASVNVAIPLAPIGFRFDGTLDHFDVTGKSSSLSGSYRIVGASANVLLGFSPIPLLGPYLIGGVGYYDLHSDLKAGTVSWDPGGCPKSLSRGR